MPYVQSESSILYSLHRNARSRGLQAGRERELVPGLCVEWRGLLVRVRYRALCVACTVCLSVCVRVLLAHSLEASPVTPFYSGREARGQYMDLLRDIL